MSPGPQSSQHLPEIATRRKSAMSRAAWCCTGAFLACLVLFFAARDFWERQNLRVSDALVRHAKAPSTPHPFAQVLIERSSLSLDQLPPEEIEASPPLKLMSHGFPWSRAVYADAIDQLLSAGASLVILDIILVGERDGDAQLRETLAKYPGKVVIMSKFAEDLGNDFGTTSRYVPPSETAVPPEAAIGFATFLRDSDGILRQAPFRESRLTTGTLYSSPATAIRLLKGEDAARQLPDSAYFIPSLEALAPDVRVPLWQLFSPAEWKHNLKNGEVFRNRIVGIGAADQTFHDEFTSALGTFPGVGYHLAAIAAAWEGAFYKKTGLGGVIAGLLAGCLLCFVCWWVLPGELWRAVVLAALLVCAVPASVFVLDVFRFMPPLLPLMGAASLSAVSCVVAGWVSEARERALTRRTLDRYVSPALARAVLDHRSKFLQDLGGVRREVTILFSDVRGFTSAAENGEPEEVFEELNRYFGHIVTKILDSGGAVDKFLGDGILAVWGSLSLHSAESEASAAINCAHSMREALIQFNAQRLERNLVPWKIGIGLHSGSVLFGNVGTRMRMEPTVIGDTVNLASRIEGLTKSLGCDILFSESTALLGGGTGLFRPADLIRVVGRRAPVSLWTYWPESFSEEDRALHVSAIAAFRKGEFETAMDLFGKIFTTDPQDGLSQTYLDRTRRFQENPPPADWGGVVTAGSK